MAFKIVGCDNIREGFAPANSTTISLTGAVPNSNSIGSKLSNGDTSWFTVRNGAEFSTGEFTYNTGTPNTLTQTTVKKSSNGNAPVTFSSGSGAEAYIDLPSYVADVLNLVAITVTSAATMDIGAVDGRHIASSGTTGPVTSFGTSTNKERLVKWSGQTITHNGTSVNMLGAANYVTTSGDYSLMKSDASGNWFEIFRSYGAIVPFDRRAPGAIGGTTPSTVAATTISATGAVDLSAAGAGQIAFPATQNASAGANTLDDYEEGTWTPSIGGNATYTAQAGTYTKIGRHVSLTGHLTINAIGTGSTGQITGAPFAAGSLAAGCVGYFNNSNVSVVFLSCYLNASTIDVTGLTAAAAVTNDPIGFFKSSADLYFSLTYQT